MKRSCPHCGKDVVQRNPVPTVDVVVFVPGKGLLLVYRANEPEGWALPGGFVDYGETVEQAAIREAKEETGLDVELVALLGVYSDPARDPRQHTMSVVFIAQTGNPEALQAGDDAAKARFFPLELMPQDIAFDHSRIISDFISRLARFKK